MTNKTNSKTKLVDFAEHLKAAIDVAVSAFDNPGTLDRATDDLTTSAKRFASQLLAQRIKLKFAETTDPKTGKSVQSLNEKIEMGRQIRDWLSPWNFGFQWPSLPEISVQLFAGADGTQKGSYRLEPYGSGHPKGLPLRQWDEISAVLKNPQLVDVTDFVYRHNYRGRGSAR